MPRIYSDKLQGDFYPEFCLIIILITIFRKQSTTPAVSSIMRDKKVQFLPVQWRANFSLDADEEKRREDEGLDNDFTLSGMSSILCLAT